MNSLKHKHWLNDAIIDGFMLSRTLLQHAQQNYVDVCVVSSHVMKTIEQTNNVCVDVSEEHSTMSSSDIWLIPINVDCHHWILTIVFIKWKMILYLDSMRGFSETVVSRVQGFIAYQLRKSSKGYIVWSEWTLHAPNDIMPQQDSSSCGVHVCLYTHVLCSGCSFTFPHNMKNARMWIAKELQTLSCSNKRAFLPILHKSTVKNLVPKPLPISRNPPAGQKSTMTFLASAISEYFKSTSSFCFMSDSV
jgi:Ulp1 family protease